MTELAGEAWMMDLVVAPMTQSPGSLLVKLLIRQVVVGVNGRRPERRAGALHVVVVVTMTTRQRRDPESAAHRQERIPQRRVCGGETQRAPPTAKRGETQRA